MCCEYRLQPALPLYDPLMPTIDLSLLMLMYDPLTLMIDLNIF